MSVSEIKKILKKYFDFFNIFLVREKLSSNFTRNTYANIFFINFEILCIIREIKIKKIFFARQRVLI